MLVYRYDLPFIYLQINLVCGGAGGGKEAINEMI